jgi:hypothetical protein
MIVAYYYRTSDSLSDVKIKIIYSFDSWVTYYPNSLDGYFYGVS